MKPAAPMNTAPEIEKLTPEQIENWRTPLITILGPYALVMPVAQIQAMRDKMQEWCERQAEKK